MTKKKHVNNVNGDEPLRMLANGDPALVNQLTHMLKGSFEESGLTPETFMLVRLAALTAVDATPASWYMNLKAGQELGVSLDKAVGTLIAVSPVVGTPRIVSAAGSILTALKIDQAINEVDEKEAVQQAAAR
jgi:hypothetical protein